MAVHLWTLPIGALFMLDCDCRFRVVEGERKGEFQTVRIAYVCETDRDLANGWAAMRAIAFQ